MLIVILQYLGLLFRNCRKQVEEKRGAARLLKSARRARQSAANVISGMLVWLQCVAAMGHVLVT